MNKVARIQLHEAEKRLKMDIKALPETFGVNGANALILFTQLGKRLVTGG